MLVRTFCMLCLSSLCMSIFAQTKYDLKASLQTAREYNLGLKSEHLSIGMAQSDVITAGLRPNPTLNNQSLQLMNSRYFPENTSWSNWQNRQVWWQLTKTWQWPGQRQSKIQTAEYRLRFTEKQFDETERNLYMDVASKWLDVWMAQKQLDILFAARLTIDSLSKINEYRFQKEVITETDMLRTQLLAKQVEVKIKTAQQEYFNEVKNLKFLLGVQDSIVIDTSDNFLYTIPPQLDSLINLAVMSRPDVAAAKSYILLSKSNIDLQKRMAFPQPEFGVVWNPQNAVPYFGLFTTIDIPLFSRNQGEIRKSFIMKDQAQDDFLILKTQAQIQVENSYNFYSTQKRNMDAFEEILQQSQRILNNVKYSYLHGGTTIIDYLEAQRSWLETRQQYFDTLDNYKQSYIQLLYDTGLINQLAL